MRATITPTYDAAEVAAVITRIAAAQEHEVAENRRKTEGARFSIHYECPVVLTHDEIVAKAEAEVTANAAFRATPRGRFLAAVREMEDLGHDVRDLRSLYSRSLGITEVPTVSAIAAGLAMLNRERGEDAADARAALIEMLAEAGEMARAA